MNRTRLVPIVGCLCAGLCYAAPAFAYLDPGTGSIILQGLIAGIAGALVVGKLYWERIKQFFARLLSRGKNEGTDNRPEQNDPQSDSIARTATGAEEGGKNERAK